MGRLTQSFQKLLQNHRNLKKQNDELIVRLGMEQQSVLKPILKGRQIEEDSQRGGIIENTGDDADNQETIGFVATQR